MRKAVEQECLKISKGMFDNDYSLNAANDGLKIYVMITQAAKKFDK